MTVVGSNQARLSPYSNRQRRWSQTPYSVGSNPTGDTKIVIPLFDNCVVHPPHLRRQALTLHADGVPFSDIYRQLQLSRNTVAYWLYRRREPAACMPVARCRSVIVRRARWTI